MGGQIYFNDIYDNGKYLPQIFPLKYCNKYFNTQSAVHLFLEQLCREAASRATYNNNIGQRRILLKAGSIIYPFSAIVSY